MIKNAVTLEALHTHTHTHTHNTFTTKERRYTYYLSVSPIYLVISIVRRLRVRGGLIA